MSLQKTFTLLLSFSFFVAFGITHVKASYCYLDFKPVLYYYENGTMTQSFNLTKLNSTFYKVTWQTNITNQTNTTNQTLTHTILLRLACNQTKTYFLIDKSATSTSVKPGEKINISFVISPVLFTKYTIKSFGVFNIKEKDIKLDKPYQYNFTAKFPLLPTGTYYQVFEIYNGAELRYKLYTFKNTLNPKPEILDFVLRKTTFGKNFVLKAVVKNTDTLKATFYNKDKKIRIVPLENTSKDYFKATVALPHNATKVCLQAKNKWTQVSKCYPFSLQPLSFTSKTLLFPAIFLNQTSKLLLINFSVDTPIPIKIKTNRIGNNTDYDLKIVSEIGTENPPIARTIYAYITPHNSEEGKFVVFISSQAFKPINITVDFLPSSSQYSPIINISYYGHATHCALKGKTLTESKYYCYFTLPYNINPENLQNYEYRALKQSYEMRINSLQRDVAHYKIMLIGFVVFVAVLFGLVIAYRYRQFIFAWMGGRLGG